MVEGVFPARAQNASGASKLDRTAVRGQAQPARGSSATGQQTFGANFAESNAALSPVANDQTPVGGGLLSTGVQILLAETRSQEAAAPFVPPSNVGRAIDRYQETQTQVLDTIRGSGAFAASTGIHTSQAAYMEQASGNALSNETATTNEAALLSGSSA